jgi:4-hydroxyphenylpyruvate dioxygenase
MTSSTRPAGKAVENPFFLNTVVLGGCPAEKIAAAGAAGFDQIELWRQDVDSTPGETECVRGLLCEQSLRLTDYQVLLDFDGAPGERRATKRKEARSMLDEAVQLGASTLLTPASTDCECDPNRVEEDMRWLAGEAASRGLRVAYEGMAWSTYNSTIASAWDLVERLAEPNLGLVVDAFHLFMRGGTADDLAEVDPHRIYLVQLSDVDRRVGAEDLIAIARHRRLLPGDGDLPLGTVTRRLRAMGYAGPVGIEVFNDNLKAEDPASVAQCAMESLGRCWGGRTSRRTAA